MKRATGIGLLLSTALLFAGCAGPPQPEFVEHPAEHVDPLIGTANGGNTFPGAVLPFGMIQWSPENTRGDATRRPAPGGYQYDATRIRGFSLTHLSGTGCRGASGDIPFMPHAGPIGSSPSADLRDRVFAERFSHANETAEPGYYQVRFNNGVDTRLTVSERAGRARFTFPPDGPAHLLIRTSDCEVGSGDARVWIDEAEQTVRGWVSSGNFCGYLDEVNRRDYYTLYFIARFDRPFSGFGTWEDDELAPGSRNARGGTGYDDEGYPVPGRGSGAWLSFDTAQGSSVGMRVGISYVSIENARANLEAEIPESRSFETVRHSAREVWDERLRSIRIAGADAEQRKIFYTALYHALLHPNLFSDVNGQYRGFDQQVYSVQDPQQAQYANFSGWDVYRCQLQLVTLLDPAIAGDIAQSLLNQAITNRGVWDRWTHNQGATHVMTGDPSAPSVAGIYAFGGREFDVETAFSSLVRAATVPTPLDLSPRGCPISCVGQRPSLDKWLTIHYLPTDSHAWGAAGGTLEAATADFSLSQLALRLGEEERCREFLARSHYWHNLWNPDATSRRGYIQNRDEDGSWPRMDPASSRGFAEGSSAQYTWMVPFDVRGLFDAMGGDEEALERLDDFFHTPDGDWALTDLGGLHAEMDNEPSIGAPWLYLFAGRPEKTQATVRQVLEDLWSTAPSGIPGNDDLGSMSSWYVWAAMGLYPGIPGRADLLLGSPLFEEVRVRRGEGSTLTIRAPGAAPEAPFVRGLRLDGEAWTRCWVPEEYLEGDLALTFELGSSPDGTWGRAPDERPPSFGPPDRWAATDSGPMIEERISCIVRR